MHIGGGAGRNSVELQRRLLTVGYPAERRDDPAVASRAAALGAETVVHDGVRVARGCAVVTEHHLGSFPRPAGSNQSLTAVTD